MGLNDFKTSSSSTGNASNRGSSSKQSSQKTLTGSQVPYCVDKWGDTSYELLRDPNWVSDRLEEGWGMEKFTEELAVFPRSVMEAFKQAVKVNQIELDDIPDYDGRSFKSNHLKWYVEMALKHKELTDIPSDETPGATDERSDLPDEFIDSVDSEHSNSKISSDPGSTDDEQLTGLEAFKT